MTDVAVIFDLFLSNTPNTDWHRFFLKNIFTYPYMLELIMLPHQFFKLLADETRVR